MQEAPLSPFEPERVASLRQLGLIAAPANGDFDRIGRLAARFLQTPMALVNFVDDERQWHMANLGLPDPSVERCYSFCAHAIADDAVLVIPDASRDQRFHDNPLVTGPPYIGAYAGVPIHDRDGYALGSLCVLDHHPREFSATDLDTLRDLARMAEIAVNNRRLSEAQGELLRELDAARRKSLICGLTQVWNRRGFDELFPREKRAAESADQPLALLLLDLDHFKAVNDRFGHETGDNVLRLFAHIVRLQIGDRTALARMGGEEFAVLLRAQGHEAWGVGEALVEAVRRYGAIPGVPDAGFTVSAGMVVCAGEDVAQCDQSACMRQADNALYAAKHAGRDRCVTRRFAPQGH